MSRLRLLREQPRPQRRLELPRARRLPMPTRDRRLRELIPLEIAYRRLRGEQPALEEYQVRFPMVDATWLAREIGGSTPPEPAPFVIGETVR